MGQEFESLNNVYEFYNKYVKELGFRIRSNSSNKDRDIGEYTRKEYVCYKKKELVKVKKHVIRKGIREECKRVVK